MRPIRGAIAALLCATAQVATGQAIFTDGFEAARSGLGTNLESVEDFAAAYPFTDFFKQSRPWLTASQTVFDTDDAAQLDLDADGWVQSLPACTADPQQFCFARTVINSAEAPYPSGNYLVLHDGTGTIAYSGGASRVEALSTPGRDVVAVNGNSIWIMTLQSTAAAPNHVRNIRILPPGFDSALAAVPTFHPDFVARLAPYRALRFMDWMRTNGGGFGGAPNPQVEFTDRALVADAHWTREAGVPLEAMIELSNLVDAEPWFTLPHQASDAYVTAFAQVVLARLDAGRRVYVEHSNEVWNNFPQRFDVEDDALANFPGGSDSDFTKRMNQHGLRTAQIC
ncbi:MAG TPA: cellulose-binding protein, partial [Candidatus Saccharimonadia bacterium]|nr:cellulose-binding protein [Candidatus Saccharimonadia bacterium]